MQKPTFIKKRDNNQEVNKLLVTYEPSSLSTEIKNELIKLMEQEPSINGNKAVMYYVHRFRNSIMNMDKI